MIVRPKIILLLILLQFVHLDCKRKKIKWDEMYLDEDYSSFVVAKNGSWFAYKDTNSLVMDTLTIANFKREIKERDEEILKFEHVSFDLKSKVSRTYSFRTDPRNDKYLLVPWQMDNSGSLVFIDEICFFSPSSLDEIEPAYRSTKYNAHYDSIKVLGRYYYDVREYVNIRTNVSDLRTFKKILWARNVGMILREYHNGEIWGLEEYYKAQ